jgi:ABC-2 type transport system ATP-binding protein
MFSGLQNLKLLSSMSGGAKQKRIEEVLEIVGLKERAKDPVQIYSHGMRQRLGIAQSLLPSPEFIILDEPTDGLDPQGIREMRHLIHRLRDEFRITVMLSSHLLNEVEQICNRVAIIDKGRLIYQGSVEKLVGNTTTVKLTIDRAEEAYKLLANINTLSVYRNGDSSLYLKIANEQIPDINALLVGKGFRVTEISLKRETLEQVFLRLTKNS